MPIKKKKPYIHTTTKIHTSIFFTLAFVKYWLVLYINKLYTMNNLGYTITHTNTKLSKQNTKSSKVVIINPQTMINSCNVTRLNDGGGGNGTIQEPGYVDCMDLMDGHTKGIGNKESSYSKKRKVEQTDVMPIERFVTFFNQDPKVPPVVFILEPRNKRRRIN